MTERRQDEIDSYNLREARVCLKCGRTEVGWRYNRCPNCGEMADSPAPSPEGPLDRLLNVARGCHDYGGGYKDPVSAEIYHHGIATVISALEAAAKNDPSDGQVNILERIGAATGAPVEAAPQGVTYADARLASAIVQRNEYASPDEAEVPAQGAEALDITHLLEWAAQDWIEIECGPASGPGIEVTVIRLEPSQGEQRIFRGKSILEALKLAYDTPKFQGEKVVEFRERSTREVTEARREIASLHSQLAAAKQESARLESGWALAGGECDDLKSKLKQARADAELFDWAEKNLDSADKSGYGADDYWWKVLYNDGNQAEGSDLRKILHELAARAQGE